MRTFSFIFIPLHIFYLSFPLLYEDSHPDSPHSYPDSQHPHPYSPHSHPDSPHSLTHSLHSHHSHHDSLHSHPDSLHSHSDSPHSHHSFHSVPRLPISVFTDSLSEPLICNFTSGIYVY